MKERSESAVPQDLQEKQVPFTVKPGDEITDSFGLWAVSDRMAEELGTCCACSKPTFRVVTITSAAKLERRAALCGKHFAITARAFTSLKSRKNPDAS